MNKEKKNYCAMWRSGLSRHLIYRGLLAPVRVPNWMTLAVCHSVCFLSLSNVLSLKALKAQINNYKKKKIDVYHMYISK